MGSGVRIATPSAAPDKCEAQLPHSDKAFRVALSVIAMNCQGWEFLEDWDGRMVLISIAVSVTLVVVFVLFGAYKLLTLVEVNP